MLCTKSALTPLVVATLFIAFAAFAQPSFANGASAPNSGEALGNRVEQLRLEQEHLQTRLAGVEERLDDLVSRVDAVSQQPLDKQIIENLKQEVEDANATAERMFWLQGALFLLVLLVLALLWWKLRGLEQRMGP